MIAKKEDIIAALQLREHPEGGFHCPSYAHPNNEFSCIYFMVTKESPSHFHCLTFNETLFHHSGADLIIHRISPDGQLSTVKLGTNVLDGAVPQLTVEAQTVFAMQVPDDAEYDYALISCLVVPAFDYKGFTLCRYIDLAEKFPSVPKTLLKRLCKI